jgi:hypothetical protein
MCRSSREGYPNASFVEDLVPVLGKWGKGDEKGGGHQDIDSYYGGLVLQTDIGSVKAWQQRVRM